MAKKMNRFVTGGVNPARLVGSKGRSNGAMSGHGGIVGGNKRQAASPGKLFSGPIRTAPTTPKFLRP